MEQEAEGGAARRALLRQCYQSTHTAQVAHGRKAGGGGRRDLFIFGRGRSAHDACCLRARTRL